ncbi:MAG: ECF transporter S component [Armatimonadota bacterium]|nr:ECF transporter S component [Armatimonadota bacterium]
MPRPPDTLAEDLALAAARLRTSHLGFVIVHEGRVLAESADPGLGALLDAAAHLRDAGCRGAALADRIVGAAAVVVAAWGGLEAVHAGVASDAAERHARALGLTFTADRRVPMITNRAGTGPCPFETAVAQVLDRGGDLDEAVAAVRETAARVATRGRARHRARAPWPELGAAATVTMVGVGVALAVVLPVAFHAVGLGPSLLPMHLPVLLLGALVGPRVGCLVGLLAPGLSHLLTGMPPLVPPVAPLMTAELATYGLVMGAVRRRLVPARGPAGYAIPDSPARTSPASGGRSWSALVAEYVALVVALTAGRAVLGLVAAVVGPVMGLPVPARTYLATAIVTGLPGIVVQLAVVPALVWRLEPVLPLYGQAAPVGVRAGLR